jgi:hypothetical protein
VVLDQLSDRATCRSSTSGQVLGYLGEEGWSEDDFTVGWVLRIFSAYGGH